MQQTTNEAAAQSQQRGAIEHVGAPARLLAGPGTGKTRTLTNRIVYLINEGAVFPTNILALTFTRAAAYELAARVREAIGPDQAPPSVSTIHSFSLRQLLKNGRRLQSIPQPLRIADDWEERWIILEDLKVLLRIDVRAVRRLLAALSSDWETLSVDQPGWAERHESPQFLGAWSWHRDTYGYTLRGELVYQFKRALEQYDDLDIDGPPTHLLIDEYQDLNACELHVIEELASGDAELFVAGDDDQSIYGFRNAHPEGIRRFPLDFDGALDHPLTFCWRCAPSVLQLAQFVIRHEPGRIEKTLVAIDPSAPGDVRILRYGDQDDEAQGIARYCRELVDSGLDPSDIMILLRQDQNGAFSDPIVEALGEVGLPVHVSADEQGPLDTNGGRKLLSLLRIAVNDTDSLAWRTLVDLDDNRLGAKAVAAMHESARDTRGRFASVILANVEENKLGRSSEPARVHALGVLADVEAINLTFSTEPAPLETPYDRLLKSLTSLQQPTRITNEREFEDAVAHLVAIAQATEPRDLAGLLGGLGAAREEDEPVVSDDSVNVLTMHRAKGLEAHTVIVAAAEDEYLPGKAETTDDEDESRRLLYVSLTRARHNLLVTYCQRRTGAQMRMGSGSGIWRRLSRFLSDGPIRPQRG